MRYTILLIEDNEEISDYICMILQLARYNVILAPNGKLGVNLAQEKHPDLILCDIMMPVLDGYGVMHILNSNPDTANIPFIFLTAKSDNNDFRDAMNLGADDYLTKPFKDVDLLRAVELRLKKREILKLALNADQNTRLLNNTDAVLDLQKLVEHRPARIFKKREHIFMEGQTPGDLYLVEKGQVKTYKLNCDGKELITGIYLEGDFLGYVSLFEEKPYHESAEVLEDARVTTIPKSDFLTAMCSNKDVATKFIKMLSNHLIEMENQLLAFAYQSVRQRVANALITIDERLRSSNSSSVITFARKDISNIVGTATESVNRTLADFKDEGLIEVSCEGLKIINKEGLRKQLHSFSLH